MDVHPTKNVSIGIDPYPYIYKNPKTWQGLGALISRRFFASEIFPVLQASDSPMALAGRGSAKCRGSSRSPGDTLGSSSGVNDEFDTKWRGKGLGKLN